MGKQYYVISPVRDEAAHISKTINSMVNQSVRPIKWIIVNDGSTDATSEIINKADVNHKWIQVIHRPNRGYRKSGGGVVEAFNCGLKSIDHLSWDFLVKLDGDLSFDKYYFQQCFDIFTKEKSLGIGGGTVYNIKNSELVIDSIGDPPFHVRGATKIYRQKCWDDICPLLLSPGWDTIDEIKANMHGWTTRTFPQLKVVQNKPTGSADGVQKDCYKNGLGSYISGYHPLFMAARCFKQLIYKRSILNSISLMLGYFSGYAKRIPQIQDRKAIRYLRQQQIKRLLLQQSIYKKYV